MGSDEVVSHDRAELVLAEDGSKEIRCGVVWCGDGLHHRRGEGGVAWVGWRGWGWRGGVEKGDGGAGRAPSSQGSPYGAAPAGPQAQAQHDTSPASPSDEAQVERPSS